MTRKNPLQSEAGSISHRPDDVVNPPRQKLSLQWKPAAPTVLVQKEGPFFRVVINPPIAEDHPDRRPQTFGTLATAEREAAVIAKIIGGNVVSNVGGNG